MESRPKILIVVFDGLQPAQVTPELMPNLSEFARTGVTFANHHPVFPSVTRVNVSSVVTGCLPGKHGLAGNTLLWRDFDPHRVIPAMEPTLQAVADATGKVLLAPAMGNILGERGLEYLAIGTGTSGNAYLQNPGAAQCGGATIHPDFTLPRSLHAELCRRFGDWPEQSLPGTARLQHARRIFTDHVLSERDPAVALLWSSEPDKTQHEDGVGLGRANRAIFEADHEFGELLGWLDRNSRADTTDVFVASDHGYSTISEIVPVEQLAREAGFPTIDQPGGVAVANNGGSVLLYVHDADPNTGLELTRWLQSQPWCGSLLASERLGQPEGTLPAALIGCDGPRSPDLILSFKWNSDTNASEYAGMAPSTGGAPGQGQHGSMSRHELHNVGFARGPSLRNGSVISTPTGNIDLTPTILHLLGVDAQGTDMDGRVIREALADSQGESPEATTKIHRAEAGEYRQEIRISSVGGARYVDWGNRV